MSAENDYFDSLKELVSRTQDIGEERFKREFMSTPPIEVSDGLRLDAMHKKILRLQDRVNEYAYAKTALEAYSIDLRKQNEELIKENQKSAEEIEELKIKLDKVYSRFDILDL